MIAFASLRITGLNYAFGDGRESSRERMQNNQRPFAEAPDLARCGQGCSWNTLQLKVIRAVMRRLAAALLFFAEDAGHPPLICTTAQSSRRRGTFDSLLLPGSGMFVVQRSPVPLFCVYSRNLNSVTTRATVLLQ